jgi:D-3-phosphoglycerate dehydrogenase
VAKFKVAMIDYDYESVEGFRLELARHDADFAAQHSQEIEDAMRFARDADGVIVQKLGPVDGRFMDALTRCKVIGRTGIGIDPIDVAAATERGIVVVNVPAYCEQEVSDHAMALALTLLRKIVLYDRSAKSGVWDFNVGRPIPRLAGRVFGLLGFGKIPRLVAPKARAFGFEVIAHDPHIQEDVFPAAGVRSVSADDLFRQADLVSVHAPLTPQTRGLVGARQIGLMKRTAFLVNTSRGPVVDREALLAALREGRIAGAGLDVLPDEPPKPGDPFLQLDNVVLTPHAGYYSEESLQDLHTLLARYVGQVLNGRRPEGLYNREVLSKVPLA